MIDGYYKPMQTPKQPQINQGNIFNVIGETQRNTNQFNDTQNTIEDEMINSINEQLISNSSKINQWGKNSIYKMFTNKMSNKSIDKESLKSKSEEYSSKNSIQSDNLSRNIKDEYQAKNGQSKNGNIKIELSGINQNSRIHNQQSDLQKQQNNSLFSNNNNSSLYFNQNLRKKDNINNSDDDDNEDEEEYNTSDLPQKNVPWNKSYLNESVEKNNMNKSGFSNINSNNSSFLNKSLFNRSSSLNITKSGNDCEMITSLDKQKNQSKQNLPYLSKQSLQFSNRHQSYDHTSQGTQLNLGLSQNQQQQNSTKSNLQLGQINNQRISQLHLQGISPKSAGIIENKEIKSDALKNAKLSNTKRRQKLEPKHYKAIFDKSSFQDEGNGKDNEKIDLKQKIKRKIKQKIVQLLEIMPFIQPSSLFKIIWDISQMILQIYTFWIIPLSIATGLSIENLVGDPFSHIIIPVLLLLDLFVTMNTGINKNGITILDKGKIFENYYYEGGLLFDIIALLSVICIYFRSYHNPQTLDNYEDPTTYFLVIYFIKYFQFKKIAKKVEDRMNFSSKVKNSLALFNLFSNVLLISHFFTCIWIFVGVYQQITNCDSYLNKRNIYNMKWETWYIQTIYYVVVTMTTVGYGDVTPATNFEFVVSVVIMLFACGIFAYNVNAIGAILDEFYRQKRQVDEKLATINEYMSRHNITLNLRYQIREFLENYLNKCAQQHEELESQIINELPEYMKESLNDEVHHVILKKSPIFTRNFSNNICKGLTRNLQEVHFLPNQFICLKDTVDDSSIYFIRNGTVQVSYNSAITQFTQNQNQIQSQSNTNSLFNVAQNSPKSSFLNQNKQDVITQNSNNYPSNSYQVQTPFSQSFFFLSEGDSFGEISFFTGQLRSATIRSVDFTTLVKIKRQDFIQLLKNSAPDYEKFCLIRDRLLYSQKQLQNTKMLTLYLTLLFLRLYLNKLKPNKFFSQTSSIAQIQPLYHKNHEFPLQINMIEHRIKCYACQLQDHLMDSCPVVHAAPKKYLTIKKYLYSPILERIKHSRNLREKFSTLKDRSLLLQAAQELYPEGIFDKSSGDEFVSTSSSESCSDSGFQTQNDRRSRSSSMQSNRSKKSSFKNQLNTNSPRGLEHKQSQFAKFFDKKKSVDSGKNFSESSESDSDSESSQESKRRRKKKKSLLSSTKIIEDKQYKQQNSHYYLHSNALNQISENKLEEDQTEKTDSSLTSVELTKSKKFQKKGLSININKNIYQKSSNNKQTPDSSLINEITYQQQYTPSQERKNSRQKHDSSKSPLTLIIQRGRQSSQSSKSSSPQIPNIGQHFFGQSQLLESQKLISDQYKGIDKLSTLKSIQKQPTSQVNNITDNQNQIMLTQITQQVQRLVDKFLQDENTQERTNDKTRDDTHEQINFDSSMDSSKDYKIYFPQYNQSLIIEKYNNLKAKQNQSVFVMAFQASKKQDQIENQADSPTKSLRGRSSVFMNFKTRFSVAPQGLR